MVEAPATLPSERSEYAVGDLIVNRYRLERQLGEGAQGSVWLAHNVALDKDVALKLVYAERSSELPILRLEKEARAAARLGHPAVVRVFDFGRTASGDAFIVMEYLEGQSLGEKLFECGRLTPVEALRTLLPIVDALVAAHARGIVHRDLKPENVFLARDGDSIQPKLLDFGIAKLNMGPWPRRGAITAAGVMVGSPAYVSPEQAACLEDVGEHTDVWSFCVVLYECLTGKVPFDSEDYPELFRQIGHEPPESTLDHGVGDLELWEIIRHGLAKSPKERWVSMQSLGQAMAAWLTGQGVHEDISGILLESKWLLKPRSDPATAMSELEPSSFVRRVRRDPALRTTERAPVHSFRSKALIGGAVVAAVLALAYVVVALASSDERPQTAVLVESKPPSPVEPKSSSIGLVPLAPAPEPKANVETPARSSGTSPAADRKVHARETIPRPEATHAELPSSQPEPPASAPPRGELLDPYETEKR
ncbi:MAG TPA: protein kinase [Polyangiaceae bacterium]